MYMIMFYFENAEIKTNEQTKTLITYWIGKA